MIKINGAKLYEELRKQGKDLKETSLDIGYSAYYLNDCCAAGQINNITAKYLEKIGITLDKIQGGEDTWGKTYNTRVEVDPIKLYNYSREHHITYTEMAKKIGRGKSFISNYVTGANKQMHIQDVNNFKEKFGIDITYKEPAKESDNASWQEVAAKTTNDITGGINAIENISTKPKATVKVKSKSIKELTQIELEKLIYRAVYSAIKHTQGD